MDKQTLMQNQRVAVICLILLSFAMASSEFVNICSWNMRSLLSAGPYIRTLCQSSDIIVASEHRLYSYELSKLDAFFPGYNIYAKSSADLNNEQGLKVPGHCGLLIAWSQE
jgi:hypothetical protein